MEGNYITVTREVKFELNNDNSIVCPYCQSGWVILTVGIENHEVNRMATCNPKRAFDNKKPLYCPFCGKDMTDMFQWK